MPEHTRRQVETQTRSFLQLIEKKSTCYIQFRVIYPPITHPVSFIRHPASHGRGYCEKLWNIRELVDEDEDEGEGGNRIRQEWYQGALFVV